MEVSIRTKTLPRTLECMYTELQSPEQVVVVKNVFFEISLKVNVKTIRENYPASVSVVPAIFHKNLVVLSTFTVSIRTWESL